MSGHWLTGYGVGVDPGWGPMIDGRSFTDTVNHFILVLQSFGLVGLVPFLVMNLLVIKELINAYKASVFDPDRWLVWCLLAGFFGLWAAFMSVSLFAQPTSIYYMMIGFTGAMPVILGGRRVVTGTTLVSGSVRRAKPVLG
jgi:O-antigen ligase